MTSKIFQANHQNQWLNTKVGYARGPVIELLELVAKIVALVIELSTPIVNATSLAIDPLAPISGA